MNRPEAELRAHPQTPVRGFVCDSPIRGFVCDSPMRGFVCDSPMRGFVCDSPMRGFVCVYLHIAEPGFITSSLRAVLGKVAFSTVLNCRVRC